MYSRRDPGAGINKSLERGGGAASDRSAKASWALNSDTTAPPQAMKALSKANSKTNCFLPRPANNQDEDEEYRNDPTMPTCLKKRKQDKHDALIMWRRIMLSGYLLDPSRPETTYSPRLSYWS